MDTMLICSHCGAKLKIKTAVLATKKEILCAKCRQPIPLPDAASVAIPKPAPKAAGLPTISFACVKCARKITVLRTLAGKKVKCPGCAEVHVVPEESMAPLPAPTATPKTAAEPATAAAPAAAPAAEAMPAGDPQAEVRRLSGEIRQLQDDLARARAAVTDCAAGVESLKKQLAAIGG
jgi:hypothetical protein